MRLSILTTITNPDVRQDKWREAIACYKEIADEVVVVNGGFPIDLDVKQVLLEWPDEWSWIELPKHLNAGLEKCTGDWILKLDIDQLIHENDLDSLKYNLLLSNKGIEVFTMQKMTMLPFAKYYQKGGMPILFRNKRNIRFGKHMHILNDLCFPINVVGYEDIQGYNLPVGFSPRTDRLRINFWNYDYFFKTKEFTQKEFYRFSRAYYSYFKVWHFGSSQEESFDIFIRSMKTKCETAPYKATLETHPKWIRQAVADLKEDQFGFNSWGLL